MTTRTLSRRSRVVALVAELFAVLLASLLWIAGFVAAPGFANPTSPGNIAGVVALELAAAALLLAVPAWLVRRTGQRLWWSLGMAPALIPVGTAVAIALGW